MSLSRRTYSRVGASNAITVTDNDTTAEDNLITFVADAGTTTGTHKLEMDSDLTYNPSTGTTSSTNFNAVTNLIANEEDRALFYDYLLTNLKLYFDKFEDELAGNLQEPTTPEYEKAKEDPAGGMDTGLDDPMAAAEDEEIAFFILFSSNSN